MKRMIAVMDRIVESDNSSYDSVKASRKADIVWEYLHESKRNSAMWIDHIQEDEPYYAIQAAMDIFLKGAICCHTNRLDEFIDALYEAGACEAFCDNVRDIVELHIVPEDNPYPGRLYPVEPIDVLLDYLDGKLSREDIHPKKEKMLHLDIPVVPEIPKDRSDLDCWLEYLVQVKGDDGNEYMLYLNDGKMIAVEKDA